jgi:hypothetical protein
MLKIMNMLQVAWLVRRVVSMNFRTSQNMLLLAVGVLVIIQFSII